MWIPINLCRSLQPQWKSAKSLQKSATSQSSVSLWTSAKHLEWTVTSMEAYWVPEEVCKTPRGLQPAWKSAHLQTSMDVCNISTEICKVSAVVCNFCRGLQPHWMSSTQQALAKISKTPFTTFVEVFKPVNYKFNYIVTGPKYYFKFNYKLIRPKILLKIIEIQLYHNWTIINYCKLNYIVI